MQYLLNSWMNNTCITDRTGPVLSVTLSHLAYLSISIEDTHSLCNGVKQTDSTWNLGIGRAAHHLQRSFMSGEPILFSWPSQTRRNSFEFYNWLGLVSRKDGHVNSNALERDRMFGILLDILNSWLNSTYTVQGHHFLSMLDQLKTDIRRNVKRRL